MASTTARYRSIRNVLWVVVFLNLAVASAKLMYGLMSHSAAMEADGFHSMFDGVSNVIGLVGMWFAARPADDDQPYGHAIAHLVEGELRREYGQITDVVVHIEPDGQSRVAAPRPGRVDYREQRSSREAP